jgi:hypothetical protein
MSEEAQKRKPEPDADDAESADIEVESTGDVALSPNDHDHLGQTWEGDPKSNHGLKTNVDGDEETIGLIGQSRSHRGIGVLGKSNDGDIRSVGVKGESNEGVGVTGLGNNQGMGGVGDLIGVYGRADSDYGVGILGRTYADGSDAPANGVEGYSSAGDGAGVFGRGRDGVQGVSSAFAGSGVLGYANDSSDEYESTSGVKGVTASTSFTSEGVYGIGPRKGVVGVAQTSDGLAKGVHGACWSDSGRGVVGDAFSLSGRTYGVKGSNNSSSHKAAGVRGTGLDVGVFAEASGYGDNGTVFGTYSEATNDDPDDDRTNYAIGLFADGKADNGYSYGVYARGDMGVFSRGDVLVWGDLDVSGTKNFVETVETADGPMEVAYAAVEAGRVMTEATDVARLEDGRAEIDLPAHFGMVTSTEASLSVETTPYSIDSAGLAVTERSVERIVVEDLNGAGDYEFSYTVKGTRKGHEDREVVREPRVAPETEQEMLNEEKSMRADIEAERTAREEKSAMHATDREQPEIPDRPEIPNRPETPERPEIAEIPEQLMEERNSSER